MAIIVRNFAYLKELINAIHFHVQLVQDSREMKPVTFASLHNEFRYDPFVVFVIKNGPGAVQQSCAQQAVNDSWGFCERLDESCVRVVSNNNR